MLELRPTLHIYAHLFILSLIIKHFYNIYSSFNHNRPHSPTSWDPASRHLGHIHVRKPIRSVPRFPIAISCYVGRICFSLCFPPVLCHLSLLGSSEVSRLSVSLLS